MSQPSTTGQPLATAPVVTEIAKPQIATMLAKQYPIEESEVVFIKRRFTNSVLPETGTLYNSAETYSVLIGSAYASRNSTVLLGRTIFSSIAEEQKYMSRIIGLQPTHPEWDMKLNQYWHSFVLRIPYTGLRLEIGFKHLSDTEKEPISVENYVAYKYCEKHYTVANNVEDAERSPRIVAYIESDSMVRRTQNKLMKAKQQAHQLFFGTIGSNKEAIEALAIVLGTQIFANIEDTKTGVYQVLEKDPTVFIAAASDKQLLEKAFIQILLMKGIVRRPVNSDLILYEDQTLGTSLGDAVAFLNDPRNSELKKVLEAKTMQK